MNKNNITRLLSVLLILTLVISIPGCNKIIISDNNNPTNETSTIENETTTTNINKDSEKAKAEQNKFNTYTDELFTSEIVENTINLHYSLANPKNYGINEYKIDLGNFSEEDDLKSYETLSKYIEELEDFDYNLLTSEQQLTYDIFKTQSLESMEYKDYRLYNSHMSPTNGMQSYLPKILAEYTFYSEQDVKDYLELLKLFPSYFESLMKYEKEQSDAGFFMPDFQVDKVIEQCQKFMASPDTHYMINSFNLRIDKTSFINDELKEQYKATNSSLVKETVLPTYEYMIGELSKLKGTCKNEGGLSNYKNGKRFYELLVRNYTGSDKTIDEIKTMIDKKGKADFKEIMNISIKDTDVFDRMSICPVDLSDPIKILNDLKSDLEKDFPTGPDTTFTVNYVPESMEKYTSPAYYILPPIDDLNNNVIYINKSMASNDTEDFVTLAHEGFPGHLYQTTFFYSTNPSNIRKLLSFSGYSEGWGTYAELYSYGLAGTDDNVTKMNTLNKTYTYVMYCLTDIGIHYEGWTYNETMDYLTGFGLDKETSKLIYETLIEEPAIYLAYFVGYLEFMELRESAQESLGSNFSLKEFHTFILETGPAQFELIRDRMDTWIAKQLDSNGSKLQLKNN